ncbi:MAG: hypothetical protein ABI779_14120 [Acidobacteriota bacterium]
MRRPLLLFAAMLLALEGSAQTVAVGRYTTSQELTKVFLANLRTIPNTKFTLRSSDKSGGTIQAVRLVRNQELGSLFVLVTQEDPKTVLVEATFTRNGGWFGGGDPRDWVREYAEQLKATIPDLTESEGGNDLVNGASRLERVVPFRLREPVPLGITEDRVTIDSVEVTGWPKDAAIKKAEADPEAKSKVVVEIAYSNRDGGDVTVEYFVEILDEAGQALGEGRREVGLDEGEVGVTHRVGVTMRTADLAKAAQIRVKVSPRP